MDRTPTRFRRMGLLAAACVAAVGITAAQPAQADNDFANGFEDQLGRLFAVEAFRLGHSVISHALAGPAIHYGYGADPYYDAPVVYERRRAPARRPHRTHRRAHPRYHAYDCDEPQYHDDDYAYDDRYYDD